MESWTAEGRPTVHLRIITFLDRMVPLNLIPLGSTSR